LGLEAVGAHLHPPFEELRMPLLKRALQTAIVGEADVVRDALVVVDPGHYTLLRSNSLRRPVPYTSSAPFGPTALPRWKIQFCQAESRPKILLSSVSGPPNLIEASMPVRASGENAARSSIAMRTSSSQSMSSGGKGGEGDGPRLGRRGGIELLADPCAQLVGAAGFCEEPARQAGEPVDHGVRAEVELGEPDRRRRLLVVGPRALEHVGAVGGE